MDHLLSNFKTVFDHEQRGVLFGALTVFSQCSVSYHHPVAKQEYLHAIQYISLCLMLSAEAGLDFDNRDGFEILFNPAGDRRVLLTQSDGFLSVRQRCVELSSLVGHNANNEPVWAPIMGLMESIYNKYLTIGVPDKRVGRVYITIRYNTNGKRNGPASGLIIGGIDVSPMRKTMVANGHYTKRRLPERVDYKKTAQMFIAQLERGDYDSIPRLVPLP